ncbi:unnamed protein product [Ectocarpus sp. CCAP 1310/34]|nr:unnamed protein product [Ectocarpus sp. CCAP 1310/34]
MTTAISYPRRGCHPPGLVTVANNLLRLLVVLVVLITSAAADTPGQDGGELTAEDATYIYSCDDLVMDRTVVRGSVALMGNITCAETKIIEVAQGYGDVYIVAETVMWTKGVIFEIPKGTRVDFGAAAFVFESNEEDLHRMVRGDPGGTVVTHRDEAVYYTDSAVLVIVEPSTDKNGNSNSNSEAAVGSQRHSADLAQEKLQRESEASGLDLVTFLKSCDDLPYERTPVEGIVSVTADIVCPEPKVRVCVWSGHAKLYFVVAGRACHCMSGGAPLSSITITNHGSLPEQVIEIMEGGGNVLFVATDTLYTRNVRFSVRKGEKMKFRAPALTFERDQGDTAEIFNVNGELHLRGDQHRFDDLVNTRTVSSCCC